MGIFKTPHPGEMIARDLADMGISARQFALNIGVTPATISRFLSGKTALTPSLAIRISAAMGSTPEFFMQLHTAHDLAQLRGEIDISDIKPLSEEPAPANSK